jgi:hypothetical protein
VEMWESVEQDVYKRFAQAAGASPCGATFICFF